jgi:hypothetical protein
MRAAGFSDETAGAVRFAPGANKTTAPAAPA